MKNIIMTLILNLIFLGNANFIYAQHNCDYLIITPDIFLPGASWSPTLINLQSSMGFYPVIVSITNHTTIVQIKNIIADYYNNNSRNLKYVLLIGSAKDTPIPPGNGNPPTMAKYIQDGLNVQRAEYENNIYIPFYSVHCLAYWSSTGTDVATDYPYTENLTNRGSVYLGRIPVNSAAEINNYVSKLQTYYQAPVIYSLAKDREIFLNLDVTYPVTNCRGSLVTTLNNNLISGHIPSNVNKTVLNVSEHTNGNDAFTYSADRENLFINTLNAGASIMTILSTNWSRDTLGSWFNINSSFNNLNNNTTALPFLIGTNCNVGGVSDPNVPDNCMRKLLICQNGGIIGAIAPTNGTEQHMNGDVLNKFHDLVFQDSILTYGAIFPILKNYLATNFPTWEFFYKSLTFFGDPSMYSSIYKHPTSMITSNTTWSGNIVLDMPIVIASNTTLTITPGTNIFFRYNTDLEVFGTLNAVGTSFQPITFTSAGSNWGPITIDGSGASNSILDHTIISYGNGLTFTGGTTATIQNSEIDHCTNGIEIYDASPSILNNNINEPQQNGIYGHGSGYTPLIFNNIVKKTSASGSYYHNYQGLYFTNSIVPYIVHNDVSGFCYGGYFSGGTTAFFEDYDRNEYIPNNRFRDNLIGIASEWGSYLLAGGQGEADYNSIYNNSSYDAHCYQYSTLWINSNFWGTKFNPTTYCDNTSQIYSGYNLSNDPWGNSPSIRKYEDIPVSPNQAPNTRAVNNKNISVDADFDILIGLQLERKGDIEGAINYYKAMIKNDNNVQFAFTELFKIKKKFARNDIMTNFENIASSNKYYPQALKIVADDYLQSGQFELAMNIYDGLTQNYPTTYPGIDAKFEKLFAYIHIKKDKENTTKIFSDIKLMNLTEIEWLLRIQVAEGLIDNLTLHNSANKNSNNSKSPNGYSVVNYPNPFNPSTTIKYQIPIAGKVSLKIYDILGKELLTLVNEDKTEGYYEVKFNASNYPSGVYIYQLRSNNFVSSKKMLLVK